MQSNHSRSLSIDIETFVGRNHASNDVFFVFFDPLNRYVYRWLNNSTLPSNRQRHHLPSSKDLQLPSRSNKTASGQRGQLIISWEVECYRLRNVFPRWHPMFPTPRSLDPAINLELDRTSSTRKYGGGTARKKGDGVVVIPARESRGVKFSRVRGRWSHRTLSIPTRQIITYFTTFLHRPFNLPRRGIDLARNEVAP